MERNASQILGLGRYAASCVLCYCLGRHDEDVYDCIRFVELCSWYSWLERRSNWVTVELAVRAIGSSFGACLLFESAGSAESHRPTGVDSELQVQDSMV